VELNCIAQPVFMRSIRQQWIAQLSSRDASERAYGAGEIFASGRLVADAIVKGWLADQELARLLGGKPNVTVGLAVWPETFAKIRAANDWPHLAEVPAEQEALEFALLFPGHVALDVLTSREPGGSGALAKFLVKFGEGVQQVEFLCSDVDRATVILQERFAVSPVYPQTRPGADGTRVNFFLVAAADGKKILIEFYEAAAMRF
jgi:hypothetical protein